MRMAKQLRRVCGRRGTGDFEIRYWVALATVAAAALAAPIEWAGPQMAHAQAAAADEADGDYPYIELELAPEYLSRSNYLKGLFLVRKVMLGTARLQEVQEGQTLTNADLVKKWFLRGLLPKMTKKEELENLTEHRELILNLLQNSKAKDAHDFVNELLLSAMKVFAAPRDGKQYHPAVRYNAMLIIGDLNLNEAVRLGTNKRPPEPLLKALPVLLEQYEDARQMDAIRVAALLGIRRHAEASLPEATQKLVLRQVLPLLDQKEPPEGRSEDGHRWMQRLALDIVGAMQNAGDSDSVVHAVYKIVADKDYPLWLRCEAAGALGSLRPGDLRIDLTAATGNVSTLAAMATDSTIKWLTAKMDEYETQVEGAGVERRGSPAGLGADRDGVATGTGTGFGVNSDYEEYYINLARRRMTTMLNELRTALHGPNGAGGLKAATAGKPLAESVNSIESLISELLLKIESHDPAEKGARTMSRDWMPRGFKLMELGAELQAAAKPEPPDDTPEPTGPGTPAGPGAPSGPGGPGGP